MTWPRNHARHRNGRPVDYVDVHNRRERRGLPRGVHRSTPWVMTAMHPDEQPRQHPRCNVLPFVPPIFPDVQPGARDGLLREYRELGIDPALAGLIIERQPRIDETLPEWQARLARSIPGVPMPDDGRSS